jgi:hypothetical protein
LRRPGAAVRGRAAQFIGAKFDEVGLAEFEVERFLAQGASQLDFDGIEERAAAGGVLVGCE